MTSISKDEILAMAREAGAVFDPQWGIASNIGTATFERFATLCRAPLVAELEQAKKDAERYQWLRKSHHDDDSAIGVTREHMNGWGRVVGKSLRNSDLDKAIDEAIAKEQTE